MALMLAYGLAFVYYKLDLKKRFEDLKGYILQQLSLYCTYICIDMYVRIGRYMYLDLALWQRSKCVVAVKKILSR